VAILDDQGRPTNYNRYDANRYEFEEAAFERASSLKQFGIWPGVIRYHSGNYGLTFNPVRIGLTLSRVGA